MDHRRLWQCGDRLGSVRGCRYVGPSRSTAIDPLPMGYQALDQRAVRRPTGMAGKQSAMEQLHPKLSGTPTLPPPPHAKVPTACRRGGHIEVGMPLEITRPNRRFPRGGEEGASKPMTP